MTPQIRAGNAGSWGAETIGVAMQNIPDQLSGVKLFPVMPGDKTPALSHGWQSRATNDNTELAVWNSQMDNLNWGISCGTSGVFVIDVDPSGLAEWAAMQERDPALRDAVMRSFTVKTPRGGYHHYFKGQGPSTVGKDENGKVTGIAAGIDTRGGYLDPQTGKWKSLGYVVAPGSKTVAGPKTVDGEYVALGGEILPMPPAILAIVPEKKKGQVLGLTRDPAKDQPRNVEWAKDLLNNYVKEGRVSIEGSGGNNTAFQVAASILDKAVSPALCFELMDELWNPHCSPVWEDWELEKVVDNAAKYGEETSGGSKGFEDNASAFAHFVGSDIGEEVKHAEKRRNKVQWIDDYAAAVEDPLWLLPGIIPARGTGMLFGASGSYKSFLALDMASCIAHGHSGQWGAPPVANDVLFLAGEAPIGTAKARRPAWLEWQGVTSPHRLAIYPRVPYLGDHDGWNGIKEDIAEMGLTPRLIVIDTLSRLLTGFDENSTKDATSVVGFLEELAHYYECFVLVVHHTGKDESKGARGSSVFFANIDTVLSTKKKGKGTELAVKKHKDADAPDETIYLGVKEVGKSIVLEKTDKPAEEAKGGKSSKISWTDPNEILARIQKNGGRVSNAIMCQELAGDLGLDRQKVNQELRKRDDIQWMRDGDFWVIPKGQEFDL